MSKDVWDAVYGDPCKSDTVDQDPTAWMTTEERDDLEQRIARRMEGSARRERLEAMVRAVVSGGALAELTIPSIVKNAEALLAEVDRRCEAPTTGPASCLVCGKVSCVCTAPGHYRGSRDE